MAKIKSDFETVVGKGLMGMAEMYSVKEGIPAILLHVDQRNYRYSEERKYYGGFSVS